MWPEGLSILPLSHVCTYARMCEFTCMYESVYVYVCMRKLIPTAPTCMYVRMYVYA